MFSKHNYISRLSILLILIYWTYSFCLHEKWKENQIVMDVVSYYGYLPAIYVYDDVSLKFADANPDFFSGKYWPEQTPNGGRVIKTTMGLSILYTPFFLLGHVLAPVFNEPQDGFSMPYQLFTMIGTVFYLVIGFIFLRKLLLRYFSDSVTALVIISLFFATNLYYYSIIAPLMSHAYLFSLSCVFIYLCIKWHNKQTIILSALIGLLLGLLTLIRPTMILIAFFPMLYGITGIQSVKNKLTLLVNNKLNVFIIILTTIAAGLPQLFYWKQVTGNWLYYSYTGEQFYFNNPHIWQGLFGYRKGWLIYTPVMFFAIAGFFTMKKKLFELFMPVLSLFLLFTYVLLSWWAWWYGGSFGNRAFIDLYALFALPMACFYEFVFSTLSEKIKTGKEILLNTNNIAISFIKNKIMNVAPLKILLTTTILSLMQLNIFQTWQFQHDLIHYDGMTRKAYWMGLVQTYHTADWWYAIQRPNYERAKKGLPEFFEEDEALRLIEKEFDFENIPLNADSVHYSKNFAENSKASFILNAEMPYSTPFEIPASEIKVRQLFKLTGMASIFLPNKIDKENTVLLVATYENDTSAYEYITINLAEKEHTTNAWNKIEISLDTRELRSENDKIKIYIWNKTGKEVYIDNFVVESLRPKINN